MSAQIAIFISGGGSNMRALVQSMTGDHPGRPAVVVSNTAGAGGLVWAAERGIPTEVVDHRPFGTDRPAFEAAINTALRPYAVDMICLAGFMRVLTSGFVSGWAGRMLNIHPSLLPKYKGLHTHARALDAGETHHGCSVHRVIADLDAGPLLGQARLAIRPNDTAESLAARVLVLEHALYPRVLRHVLEGGTDQIFMDGDLSAGREGM